MNNNRMMDYFIRDGRNPYGSRGGYVVDRNRGDYNYRREDNDYRAREEDYARYGNDNASYPRQDGERNNRDYARGGRDYNYGMDRQYDGNYYPFDIRGSFGRYDERYNPYMMQQDYRMYGRDGHSAEKYLSNRDLDMWTDRLMREIDDKDKQFFKKDNILKKAESMGIKFDKFTPEEFYVVVLMVYTDYCKTFGTANMDTYLKLAKDWLNDDDIAVKGSEKLSAYFYYIVEGM